MTPLEAALDYIARGWNPVPVKYRAKKPLGEDWQHRIIDAASAPRFFNGARMNVGVQMGPNSGGLTDADMDCQESIAVSYYILPPTKAVFGRASARAAHRLYQTDLAITVEQAAIAYDDPRARKEKRPCRLVELRIGGGDLGAQTVFPGSTHEDTGERIIWEETGEPTSVDGEDLHTRVALVAATALLARYWPGTGARHECAKIVGGFLSRAGKTVEEVRLLVEAAAKAAGDQEWRDRRKAAEDQATAHQAGKNTYGLPAMREMFGADIADKVAAWIDYHDSQQEEKPHAPLRQTIRPLVPLYSDDDLALRFADRHEHDLRFVDEWGRWLRWNEPSWQFDKTLNAFDFARAVCRDTATECKSKKTRSALTSARTIAAVERLAKADRRIAADIDQWNPDHSDFSTGD